jgi:integrase
VAKVIRVVWRSGPRNVKRCAWGYTIEIDKKQVRKVDAAWSAEDAAPALAARLLERDGLASPAAAFTANALDPGGPPPAPAAPAIAVKTLGEVVAEYLAYKRAKGKKTIVEDERDLTRFTAAFGKDTPLTAITAQRIAQWDRERITQTSRLGRRISPASVNRELATLRHLLRLAEEWSYIPKAPKVRLSKEPDGRMRFLSEDEATRLLEACAARPSSPHLHTIVVIALTTGMRLGEILGLRWERIDLARGVFQLELTKNGRRREVPMNETVYAALTAWPEARRQGMVFSTASGRAQRSIRTAFDRALAEAKIEDCRFDDLRHTCASWLVMAGRHRKEVQELLGHRTFAMTLRYAHLAPGRLRDAVAVSDGFFSRQKSR